MSSDFQLDGTQKTLRKCHNEKDTNIQIDVIKALTPSPRWGNRRATL